MYITKHFLILNFMCTVMKYVDFLLRFCTIHQDAYKVVLYIFMTFSLPNRSNLFFLTDTFKVILNLNMSSDERTVVHICLRLNSAHSYFTTNISNVLVLRYKIIKQ